METSSVTGLAGSCGNIIELAAKCLDRLYEAHKRFQTANFTTTILISNLSTLKAALAQIERWMSMDTLNAQHYQMIMDVDATLASCHLLLGLMDERISKLGWDSKNVLKSVSKAKVVMEERATQDCITHLSHQCSALNLLLTAFQCQTQVDQLSILQDKKGRHLLNQVKDDSSSLIGLRDEESTRTSFTRSTWSRFSLRFGFDGQLLQTKVYQQTFRSLARRATRPKKLTEELMDERPTDLTHPLDRGVFVSGTTVPQITVLYRGFPNKLADSVVESLSLSSDAKKHLLITNDALITSIEELYTINKVTLPIRSTEIRRLNHLFRLVECWCPATGDEFDHFSFMSTATNPFFLVLLEVDLDDLLASDKTPSAIRQILQREEMHRAGVIVIITQVDWQGDPSHHANAVNEQLRKSNQTGNPLFITWNINHFAENMERAARSMSDYCNTLPQSRVPGNFDWIDLPPRLNLDTIASAEGSRTSGIASALPVH
ncbi:hypothetical protein EG328_004194 [Venturia inaequalis]|uniref:Fungal N-terminal domain-containing protein n=1 Tax=Venturia inaequalis TaxID=5025 RepID=A0A8H3USC2_VENIN|nr:hypothetical protein EG328_004194 [Venturia inaequalis]